MNSRKRIFVITVSGIFTWMSISLSFALSSEESSMLFEECMAEYWLSDLKTCKTVYKRARAVIGSEDVKTNHK